MATYYTEITSDDLPILDAIKNNKFNGRSIITDGSGVKLVSQTVRLNKIIISDVVTLPKLNYMDPCSFSGMHECVAKKIDDMSFPEYVLCCASAPECYGGLWVICAYKCGVVKPT